MQDIDSIKTLMDVLEEERVKCQGTLWFRGQADEAWALIPSFLRLTCDKTEETLIKKFKQSATILLEKKPENSFEWLFQMQHYEVPTRLLDWSESPLVALYFAVAEGMSVNSDGALWILSPTALNKNAGISSNEDDYIPSFDEDEVGGYSTDSLKTFQRTKLKPIAAIAARNNPRIQAQLGVFTIHHLDKTPIEDVGDKTHVRKYIIPANHKKRIYQELSLLGISRFQIFPELSSIGHNIKEALS